MPDASLLEQLIAEYLQLDFATQSQRAKELLSQAAPLVDRAAAPKRWAALRSQYADLAKQDEPEAAIAAYRDALTVWDPREHHEHWVHCQLELGILQVHAPPGSPAAEEALAHLENALPDNPYLGRLLATLYDVRPLGDPAENWRRRIRCYELALSQTSPEQDLAGWAAVSNELASAYQDEPAGDTAAALEKRIAGHQVVLAALAAAGAPVADTCLQLATAYLDRVEGLPAENGRLATGYVQQAFDALSPDDRSDAHQVLRAQLWMLRARCLIFKRDPKDPGPLHAGLLALAEAGDLTAHRPLPELRGSVEKLRALATLELLRLGQHQHLAVFAKCCADALALFAGPTFGDERRKLLQIQADGLLVVGDLQGAGDCCDAALQLAEEGLAQATTRAGRMERIWEQRDSAGLLAYCRARSGNLHAAVDALDQGKARLWSPGPGEPASASFGALIPPGGALLLPNFAGPEGIVMLATLGLSGPELTSVVLPAFGKERVLELQRGSDTAVLGGWLHAYYFRRSDPARFQAEILSVGERLHHEFWQPVLERLRALGVPEGSELVLLPQGASACLPLQAAWALREGRAQWLAERYALRLAPSLRALRQATVTREGGVAGRDAAAGPMAIVAADPDGDLPFSALEVAWIQAVQPQAQVLLGPAASCVQVLAALHACSGVHIATHADFNVDDPLASSIRLADGALSVAALVEHLAAGCPGFIALSACETAVTRVTSLADEFLGFPAALLAAGARTVLATQWSVDDAATALLMGQFYRERATPGATAAQCLSRAQTWLRELTVAKLSASLRELRHTPGPAGDLASQMRLRLRAREPGECPYAHPYYWAGLCVWGGPG